MSNNQIEDSNKVSKKIVFDKMSNAFFLEVNGKQSKTPWQPAPPNLTEHEGDKLAQAYTNGLNAAEWKEEEEAMTAFLNSADIILTGLTSETKAKEAIFGKDRLLPILKDQSKYKGGMLLGNQLSVLRYFKELLTPVYKATTNTGANILIELALGSSNDKEKNDLSPVVGFANRADSTIKIGKDSKEVFGSVKKLLNNGWKGVDEYKNICSSIGGQVGDYVAVWAAAVVTVYYRHKNDYQNMSPEDIRKEVQFEAGLNTIAASIMGLIGIPGAIMLKTGFKTIKAAPDAASLLIGLGLLWMKCAQAVSNGVKESLRVCLDKKERRKYSTSELFSQMLKIGVKTTISEIKNWRGIIGASRLYSILPWDSPTGIKSDNSYIVVEKSIDGPSMFDAFVEFFKHDDNNPVDAFNILKLEINEGTIAPEIVNGSLKAYDFISGKKHEKYTLYDYSKYFSNYETQLKIDFKENGTTFIGTIDMIGKLYQDIQENNELKKIYPDIDFVAFYDFDGKGNKHMMELKDKIISYTDTEISAENLRPLIYDREKKKFKRNIESKIKNVVFLPFGTKELNKYLNNLSQYFGEEFAQKILEEETRIILTPKHISYQRIPEVYVIKSTELIDKQAEERGLSIAKDKLTYDDIFNLPHNKEKFIKANLAGNTVDTEQDYNYILFSIDISSSNLADYYPWKRYRFFIKNNDDILYGSNSSQNKNTSNNEKNNDFEFWTGLGSKSCYKDNSNPQKNITINGERIGTALKRRQDLEGGYEHLTSKQEYEEIIKLADDKELEVRYTYDLNGSLVEDTYLVIKYRCKDYSEDGWNNLKIKEFKDLDYGIDIPDKGESLAGSNANKVKKKENEFKLIELEGSTGKETYSKIILKNQGNYFIPAGITPIEDSGVQEKSDLREEYTIESGDTLSHIAENKLGKVSLWVEIEREDGTTFSEEEAKHLRIGSKVYLPKK